MTQFLQLLVSGVSLGAVYALLALGFVVVFKASGVVNFAHPALLMAGAYVTARLTATDTLPFGLALLAGVGAAVAVSLVIQRFLVSPMASRSAIAVSIMTIGVDVVVQTEITRRIGVDILPMGDPWQDGVVTVAGVTIPQTRIAALVVGVAVIAAFFAWFRFSTWGVAMRAVAEDPETAALMGVRRARVSAIAWMLAGALAAVAGVMFLLYYGVIDFYIGFQAGIKAFTAAVLGGIGSLPGAVLGGLLIGLIETMWSAYFSSDYKDVAAFSILAITMIFLPQGILGRPDVEKV